MGGVVSGGTYFNTDSGLTPLLDRLTASFDADAQNRAQQRGLANASAAGLTPADAPATGFLARMMTTLGVTPPPSNAPAAVAPQPTPATAPAASPRAPAPNLIGPPVAGFDNAANRTLGFEGKLNPRDTNGTPSNFGINQAAHPDIDVTSLTGDQAKGIYKTQYWDAIGGDQLPAPLARAAFDTAVIAGPGKAKELLAQSGGDPMKLMDLREQFQNGLVQQNPQKYGPYAKAWANRNMGLRMDIAALNAQQPQSATAYAPPSGAAVAPASAAIAGAAPQQMAQGPQSTGDAPQSTPAGGLAVAAGPTGLAPATAAPSVAALQGHPVSLPIATASTNTLGSASAQSPDSSTAQLPSLAQIRQLVLEPATRQLGLQLWQQYLTPKDGYTLGEGQERFNARNQLVAKGPPKLEAVREGGALVDPTHPGTPLFVNPKTETGTFQTPDQTTYGYDKNNLTAPPVRLTPQGAPSGYRPATADERKALGVGPTTPLFFGPDGKPATLQGGTQVTVNNAVNPILKGLGDQFVEGAQGARDAADSVRSIQNARLQLQGGIVSGFGADQQLALRKLGSALGFGDPSKIVNTETFMTQMKPLVLSTVKGLGAGSGISNADRDFALQAVGGSTKLEANSIGRVLDITERAARAKIDRHNGLADQMLKTQPDLAAVAPMLHITPPPLTGQAAPQPAAQDMSPLGQAKAAIAAGAPRDAVIQRLQQQGIDISGQGL